MSAGLSAWAARCAPGNILGKVADRRRRSDGGDTVPGMVRARFAEIMGSGGDDLALDEAALEIAAAVQSDVDVAAWIEALDRLSAACPEASADAVAHHLFVTEHFVGNRAAYYDWRNSCLDRVIARRAGIPISLSVLMIEVARRIGVDLVGVGMPAHFLVRLADDDDVFFDAFNGGRRLDRAGARTLFESVTGGQAVWSESHLEPTPNRLIVIRMLNNLKSVFAGRRDLVRLAIVMNLREAISELAEVEADEIEFASAVFN